MKIAVTIDVEKDTGGAESLLGLEEGLPQVLEAFGARGIKATFFVSGEVVEYLSGKSLFDDMIRAGHELASHGFLHTDYRNWDYRRIREGLCRSKHVLEDKTGSAVTGFRAPQFLLDEKIVRAVSECGFTYDSSLPDGAGVSAATLLRKVKAGKALKDAIRDAGIMEFPVDSIPFFKTPHALLWINHVTPRVYKMLWKYMKKEFAIFYMHPFDMIKNKGRIPLDFKRKVFYLRREGKAAPLFHELLDFWLSSGVRFVRLCDEVRNTGHG